MAEGTLWEFILYVGGALAISAAITAIIFGYMFWKAGWISGKEIKKALRPWWTN